MIPDELIGNLGDTHLYLNHIEQAKEQISRDSFELPILKTTAKIDGICCNVPNDFILEGYQYHPTIKAPLSN
jgi:thymidylate synthase